MKLDLQCRCSDDVRCAACELKDLTIELHRWFNRRPDDFYSEYAQRSMAKAVFIRLCIEENKGILRTIK